MSEQETELINLAIQFLQRTQLSGSEVPAYNTVINYLTSKLDIKDDIKKGNK